jgi:hypothetical protein
VDGISDGILIALIDLWPRAANVRLWHFAAFAAPQKFVAYWINNGQRSAPGLNGSAAIDPERTSALIKM